MNMPAMITCIAIAAGLSHADIVTVTLSGTLEEIFDPNDTLQGGTTWLSSITLDTDTMLVNNSSSSTYYSGSGHYQLGNGVLVLFNGELQVTDGDFDVLAIHADPILQGPFTFYALDFGGGAFSSTDLPPLGLTFDSFTSGVVGNTYQNGAFFSADVVVDTISVIPSPSSMGLLAIFGLGATRRRR